MTNLVVQFARIKHLNQYKTYKAHPGRIVLPDENKV